ncbi:MAG: recombination-associated protein RdgC [Deltaproteobacteria bacterium]|nr:recombination-associated protein RdgC [Deltaproteobacteria bacterium]
MGLLRGSASFSRFFVNGGLSENYLEEFTEKIARFSFRNLDEHSDEERSTGWVNIMDIFDTDFGGKEFFMHPYIALSWRVDVRKVPPNALKQHCIEAEKEIKRAENLEYLPKGKLKELENFIWHQLLKRAIPRTNTYDIIWNLDTSMLIFGSNSNKLCDEFAETFFKTFDLTLSPVFPYSLAYRYLETESADPKLLDAVRASNFSGDEE